MSRSLAGERGFTLVEVLVLVLIVAVLAAIALPLYINQRTKAQDGEAKAMASTTAQALVMWHQEHETFDGAGRAELAEIEPAIATARGLLVSGTATTYRVTVSSAAGGTGGGPFTIDHRSTGTDRTCLSPGRGGCPDGGRW